MRNLKRVFKVELRSKDWEEQCRRDLTELKWTTDDMHSFTLLSEDVGDMSGFEIESEFEMFLFSK